MSLVRARHVPKGHYKNATLVLSPLSEDEIGDSIFPLTLNMLSSSLGKSLISWFGPCNEQAPGKYRKAKVFYFEGGENGIVAAICEAGDRGSSWYYIPNENVQLLSGPSPTPGMLKVKTRLADSPKWLPEMLLDLAQRFALQDPDIHVDDMRQRLIEQGFIAPSTEPALTASKKQNPRMP